MAVSSMNLQPGARLGPYEIQATIGSGGMGEVYKARDTRLGRSVAIKVLRGPFALDPAWRERFEQEARVIAALAHPYICTVHDVGREDDLDYLVMEYLEGEALAQRLAKGPLPFDEVVRRGVEIAEALSAAHRHGIVHRDLKPGNVFLTKAGAKLLDFGLAKRRPALERGGEGVLSESPTRTSNLTQPGTIFGTLQYMAPEQIEGGEADARTDVWALGCVLYEMATGRPAFEGRSPASVLGAILRDQPVPIRERQPLTPPLFERLVQSCLEKDPDKRWQNAHDVGIQLEAVASSAGAGAAGADRRTPVWRGAKVAWVVAALALIMTAAVLLWNPHRTNPPRDLPITRFTIPLPRHAWLNGLALSPDGRSVAFVMQLPGEPARLHVRSLADPEPRALPQTDGASGLAWSRDGGSIAFSANGTLQRVDLAGGPPRVICPIPGAARRVTCTWGSRGVILFTAGRTLFRVAAEGGDPAPVLSDRDDGANASWPQFLPDGERFLHSVIADDPKARGTFAGSLSQPEKSVKVFDYPAMYADVPGSLLVPRGNSLLSYPFDVASLRVTGDPALVVEDLQFDLDAAGDGVLAYAALTAHVETARPAQMSQLTWFDRSGNRLGTLGPPGAYGWLALSPDGSSVVIERVTSWDPIEADLWVIDSRTSREQRLTFGPGRESDPVWSPDGREIAFACVRGSFVPICRRSASEAGTEEVLAPLKWWNFPTDWSPDGRLIVYALWDESPSSADILALRIDGDKTPRAIVNTVAYEHQARLSPDGKWIAYASDESGWAEVYLQRLDGTGGRHLVSVKGGAQPFWRRDGKEIFYLGLDMKMMAVSVALGDDPRVDDPRALFELPYPVQPFYGARNMYDVTPDGQRFLVNLPTTMPLPPSINIILNWPKAVHH